MDCSSIIISVLKNPLPLSSFLGVLFGIRGDMLIYMFFTVFSKLILITPFEHVVYNLADFLFL